MDISASGGKDGGAGCDGKVGWRRRRSIGKHQFQPGGEHDFAEFFEI